MEAGKLNRRVRLQSVDIGQGSGGGMQRTWSDVAQVWAGFRYLKGGKREATAKGGGEVTEARTEITIRYRAGVTEQLRVLHGTTVYTIQHMNDWQDGHEFIVLTCDTGVRNA